MGYLILSESVSFSNEVLESAALCLPDQGQMLLDSVGRGKFTLLEKLRFLDLMGDLG